MIFVQDISKLIDQASTSEDVNRVTELLAGGDIAYAYPYQLKEFIIKYAKFVKNNYKCTVATSSTTTSTTQPTTATHPTSQSA